MDVVSTKVLTMALLGGGSLVLGFIPLKLRRFMGWSDRGKHSRRKNIVTSILLCFGAGVLLATSFIHILPEVRDGLLHSGHMFGSLPMAEFFFCCGFFLIYFIEELVHLSVPASPEAELRTALRRIGSLSASFRRGGDKETNGLTSKRVHCDETGLNNEAELQNVNNQIASMDEVDIQTSPMGNAAEDLNDGQLSESETPVGTYNPKYRVKLNQSVHKMFPNYHPPDKKKKETLSSGCCTLDSKLCSISVRDFVTIAALSFHSIFEGLAIGLETSTADVWQLFGAIATHKFVITFCVGLELATNDTKLVSFITYMITFCLASPLGIGIGIAVSEASMLENPAHHFLTVSALQGIAGGTILYVVVFEILEREKKKSVPGLLQLTFLLIGFAVMVCIEVFGGHLHVHDISETHSHGFSSNVTNSQQIGLNDTTLFAHHEHDQDHGHDHDHGHEHGHDHDHDFHHLADSGSFTKKPIFPAKDSDHHDSHFKDFHGGEVPEQDLPPPTLDKDTAKLKLNISKRVLKIR